MKNFILGISGTHGTGKSTILNGLEAAGFAVDRTQLSREAQVALGWDRLDKAQESPENMWALQEAILGAMWDRDQRIIARRELTVVERTPADAWAYTQMWMNRLKLSQLSNQAVSYRGRCGSMANSYSKFIVLQQAASVPFEEDPRRADVASRDQVENLINNFIKGHGLPHHIIESTSKSARIAEATAVFFCSKIGFQHA